MALMAFLFRNWMSVFSGQSILLVPLESCLYPFQFEIYLVTRETASQPS